MLLTATSVMGQPSLLPPGPPTVVSGRFGPRTQISSVPYTITASGSYFLADTLTPTVAGAAITISASNVSIDLAGHSLLGAGFVGSPGIVHGPGAFTNITIHDGIVTGWSGPGIDLVAFGGGPGSTDDHIYNVTVSSNAGVGISVGTNSIVRDVIANFNSGFGVQTSNYCKMTNVVAVDNASIGINAGGGCHISDSVSAFNDADGIAMGPSCTVVASTAVGNSMNGFAMDLNCRATDCTAEFNGFGLFIGSGYFCFGDGQYLGGCVAFNNFDSGFNAPALGPFGGTSAEHCSASYNGSGSGIGDGFTNFRSVIECTASNNTDNGIQCATDSLVVRNTCNSNGGSGIITTGDGNTIQQNHVAFNALNGINTAFNPGPAGNLVTANAGHANFAGIDFLTTPADAIGPIIFGPGVVPIGANANISYP